MITRLYLIRGVHPKLAWKTKIGITGDLKKRKQDISGSMSRSVEAGSVKVEIHYVTSVPLFGARVYEKALHWLFTPLRSPAWGNGGTEWFLCVRWVGFLLVWGLFLFEIIVCTIVIIFALIGIFATFTT